MSDNRNDLLFIIPGFFYIEDYQKLLYFNDLPLGTLQISAYLKNNLDIKTQIVDLRIEAEKNPKLEINEPDSNQFKDAFLNTIENNNVQEFQNIGINCYTSFQYIQTYLIAQILREKYPNKNIIVGGYHPTAVPEDFSYNNSPFDVVIRGEAESNLLDLFNSFTLNNELKHNKTRVVGNNNCVDVNSLPFPDYELYLEKYPLYDRFNFEFYISRGCPYQCAFCATNYKFRSFRFEKFKRELEKLCELVEKYNRNRLKIAFADQSFDRVNISEKVLDYLIQNDLQERFTFSCQCRVETFAKNLNLIEKYRKSNMVIGFGFESASHKLLKEMHKTNKPKRYVNTMNRILDEYKDSNDVYCRLNVLAGFPGESSATFFETVNFIDRHALHRNIQISPTLFSNYPNVFVYKNMKYYEEKYGSKFIKEWWKIKSNPFKNSVPEKLSSSYTIKQLLKDYKEHYLKILKVSHRNILPQLLLWKNFFDK
ncbi:MAG: B12-binding domain-containing radical SAM protein, partial [Candidatus Hermodarchaeota archaeon]